MAHYRYLIVGGGMAAAAAMASIRRADEEGSIGLIGREPVAPYNRPPLTKGLWKGEAVDSIWRKVPDDNAELHLGRTATELDTKGKRVVDDQGNEYTFDKLLLATGGTPNHLPFGGDNVSYYRTLEDYQRLREASGSGRCIGVIGGGFIGSELAAGLTLAGSEVVMVVPQSGIGGKIFPPDLAAFITDYYRERGVTVMTDSRLTGIKPAGAGFTMQIASEDGAQEVEVDHIVAGLGIRPNVELAERAGLEVDDGIIVDEFLRTSAPDIYAAGDAASFVQPALETRLRVEHEDNANRMGRQAGRIMAGSDTPYTHLPMFYSDLFDLGYEAVGELDSRLEMVSDWTDPYREGVVYYLRDGRVRGVLLWHVWKQVKAARELVAEPGPFTADDLKGRLPRED